MVLDIAAGTLAVIVVVALLVLGAIAAFVTWLHNKKQEKRLENGEIEELEPEVNPVDMECCGQHEVCEKDSLLAAISKNVEYYNDEELDRFRGRQGDEYSEEECDEFRDILYTMRDDEVAGWVRSLQLRYVNLPDEIKDEVFLIIGERRQ
ncbi:MAG: phospholipase [Bacteroidales bacterium]|nr:phospholipase [Bacteroidales bacterium]